MSGGVEKLDAETYSYLSLSPSLGILASWRLQVYGYILAALYALFLLGFYKAGVWVVNNRGVPVDSDFIREWIAGYQALHGDPTRLYDLAEFVRLQEALVGPGGVFYPIWPYPPTFLLVMAPFALLPANPAFLIWDVVTLLGCIVVVYLIVQRVAAVVLMLALPFTPLVLLAGQNALLMAALLGASLHFLVRRPVLAGVFIGFLTYKPQFGVLIPIALAGANHWRALASAAATAVLLVGVSVAAFGADIWAVFPVNLLAQASAYHFADPGKASVPSLGLQTVWGLIRALDCGTALPLIAQSVATMGAATIVWLVWRSPVRYALKAGTLSAAALIATPYAFAYDMAAIGIPVAFLASDQMSSGLLRGEKTIMIALFGASLVILVSLGSAPLGAIVMITLLSVIFHRVRLASREPGHFA